MRFAIALLLLVPAAVAADPVERRVDTAKQVVVIANSELPDSLAVAKHYMERRGIPAANLLAVKTTDKETISWPDFREQIVKPLGRFIEKFPEAIYLVPVWGIPLKLEEEDPENDAPKDGEQTSLTKYVVNRDYACVDAELAMLPRLGHEVDGWEDSDLYGKDEPVTTAHKLFMVSRLDGPTPAIASALVDRAIYAETYGVTGDAWIDTRGLDAKSPLFGTDDEIRQSGKIFEAAGITIHREDTAEVQRVDAMRDCAFYWGWYTAAWNGEGAYTFRHGAVAAHLHSLSASSLRTDSRFWVGPLLAHGAACSAGTVYEPLVTGFPDMAVVLDRFLKGYTWGEACAMGNRKLSWMAVFAGDPLYAPFAKGMKDAQAANRSLAADAYVKAAAAIDAGDFDGAQATLAGVRKIGVPMEGARDVSFLERELASRRVSKATGSVDDLLKKIDEARAAREKGDDKAAQSALEKAIGLSSGSYDANFALGSLFVESGKAQQALPYLEKCQKAVPGSPGLAEPLGRAYAANGKFAEAIPLLEDAVTAGAGSDCMASLGDCFLKTKQTAKAIAFLKDATKKDAKNRAAFVALARAYEENKDIPNALKTLKEAVRIYPETADDLRAYKETWKTLQITALHGNDKREKEDAAWVIQDFDNPEYQAPTAGVAIEINKQADLAAGSDAVALGTVPSEGMKVPGLPRLVMGNASSADIRIFLKGACARVVPLRPLFNATGKDFGVFPGDYDLIVVVTRGSDKTVLTTRVTFELNRRYGMVIDNSLAMMFPPAK